MGNPGIESPVRSEANEVRQGRKPHADDGKVGLGTYRVAKDTKVMFEAVARLNGQKPEERIAALMTQDVTANRSPTSPARPGAEETKQ